jgi:hypothetical protein
MYHGEGIGILVPGPQQSQPQLKNINIEHCVIGTPGNAYATGILLSGTRFADVHHNVFSDNAIAVSALNTEAAFIGSNVITTPDYGLGIELWGPSTSGVGNVFGNELNLGDDSVGIELRGLSSGELIPIEDVSIAENEVSGPNDATGLRLLLAEDNKIINNHFSGNGVEGLGVGIDLTGGGWPNTIWHNAIDANLGLLSDPISAELSHNQGGNWWGRQCPGSLFVAGVDASPATLVDSYPYGGADYWKHGIATGCNLSPPAPPTVLSPLAGREILNLRPAVTGRAAPYTVLSFWDGQTLLGESSVPPSGDFVFIPELDLTPGSHTLSVLSTDFAGYSSTPTSLTFSLRTVDQANPLWGVNNLAQIYSYELSPRPSILGHEDSTLAIGLDATLAVAGAPPNDEFFALSRRTLRDLETWEELRTIYAATEISLVTPEQVLVSSQWDGTTTGGQWVLPDRGYPTDVEVFIGRVTPYIGRPPRCPAGESTLTLSPEMRSILAIAMPHLPWNSPIGPFLRVCTREYFDLLVLDPNRPLATFDDRVLLNPCKVKARDCAQAEIACMNSKLAGRPGRYLGEDYDELCEACRVRCEAQVPKDTWVESENNLRCDYWGNQYYQQCYFHDCSDPNAPDPCTACPENIEGGEAQCSCPASVNPCHYCQDNGLSFGEGCPGNDIHSIEKPTFPDEEDP